MVINTSVLRKAMRGKSPEIAKRLNITKVSLSRKINNHQPMTVDELIKLAQYLDLDIRDIIKIPDENEQAA